MNDREVRVLDGNDEVGRWVAALKDARARTLELVGTLSDADLLHGEPNTINAILYHLAAIEADWLYDEIRGQPDQIPAHLLPFDVREKGGRLTAVPDMSLSEHLDRLTAVRGELLDAVATFDTASFHHPLPRAHYDVSPASSYTTCCSMRQSIEVRSAARSRGDSNSRHMAVGATRALHPTEPRPIEGTWMRRKPG